LTESKKEWVTPELIVLVRSNPEEAVLVACKTNMLPGDPDSFRNGCGPDNGVGGPCTQCDASAIS
jgi:hypothetical protein